MSIVLVGNTKSGRGIATRLFERFADRLRAEGHPVTPLTLNDPRFPADARFDGHRFRGARTLVAFGGDGTVNAITDAAIRTSTPIYHVPCGNENLVARRYRMDRTPETLLKALGRFHIMHSDLGLAAGRRFLIMATIGPDARVIQRLHNTRTKALGHLAYLEPIAREALSPYLPRMTVAVDGRTLVNDRPGWLIIANDREYAARLNFAPLAGPANRSLTAVFLPATSLADCFKWVATARVRRHIKDPRCITAAGSSITLHTRDAAPIFQLDGEYDDEISATLSDQHRNNIPHHITLDEARLPVLVPDPSVL